MSTLPATSAEAVVISSQSIRPGSRIPELDGVRGLAMLLVLLAHYLGYITLLPEGTAGFVHACTSLFSAGLDLFFLLSGFLVACILLDHRDSPRYFRAFYLRRAYRVLPPYYIWIVLFLTAQFLELGRVLPGLVNRRIPAWSYFLFLQNFFFSIKQSLGPMWLSVSWSLSVEEQFYLCLPLLIWLLPRRWLTITIAAFVIAAPISRAFVMTYPRAVFLLYRADSLGLGVLLAIAMRNEKARDLLFDGGGVILLAALGLMAGLPFLAMHPQVMITWGLTWMAVLCAALLCLCLVRKQWMAVLTISPLRYLGRISYSVYLIHYPINIVLHWAILGEDAAIHTWPGAAVTCLSVFIVLATASLSWKWIEKPFLVRGAQFRF